MNRMLRVLRVTVSVCGAGAIMATTALRAGPAALPESAQEQSCSAPEYRQFDFWVGDWDVFDVEDPATPVAHTRVDRILNGCVILEDYRDTGAMRGMSFSTYEPAKKMWHQSWVTNRGAWLVIDGKFESGEVVLSGMDNAKAGLVRGTWKAVDGGVRETAVISGDSGKTWKPWFDLMFRPAAESARVKDEKTVAALDTEYQAAVKKNDAATMARILADDFLLVTGHGKNYTKADLLDEARSGRVVYEHQEEISQSVRVIGDTAVVTAKLWEKGTDSSKPFDYVLWFSDTYVRTAGGWKYVAGQSSIPLPAAER